MLFEHHYGIDLGTDTIKIYEQKKDIIRKEKNMIAIKDHDTVFAVGNDAFEMFERTPANIEVVTPMTNGRISDVLLIEVILHAALEKEHASLGTNPILYFSVPAGMSEIEKRIYSSISHRGTLKKSKVYLVEQPIADAIALAIPILNTKGSMILNFGAHSLEMSVITEGRIILNKTLPYGGDTLDLAIAAAIRRRNSFQVSLKSASGLKNSLVFLGNSSLEARKVMGTDTITGLPRDGIISSNTVTRAVQDQLITIAEEIKKFLDRIPPQIRTVVTEEGIYLTGGTTRIKGIDKFFMEYLSIPVRLSQYYESCTICGLKELIDNPLLHHWAFMPKKRKT